MVYGTSWIEGLWNGLPANPAEQLEQDTDRDQIMDCSDIAEPEEPRLHWLAAPVAMWEPSYQRPA